MSRIPREARDGLMRAWLEILRERHPGTAWVADRQDKYDAPPERAIERDPALARPVSLTTA